MSQLTTKAPLVAVSVKYLPGIYQVPACLFHAILIQRHKKVPRILVFSRWVKSKGIETQFELVGEFLRIRVRDTGVLLYVLLEAFNRNVTAYRSHQKNIISQLSHFAFRNVKRDNRHVKTKKQRPRLILVSGKQYSQFIGFVQLGSYVLSLR